VETRVRVRTAAAIVAACVLGACQAQEATPAAGPSSGHASLQTAPYAGEAGTGNTPAPAPAPAAPAADDAPLAAIATQFDPARQHFVWVLPPGIHGIGPWDLNAVIKLRGEPKFETTLPLKAEIATAGTRPEYPPGYEIVRLTDAGGWAARTAEIDKVIQDLVAEHGRGHGELEMISQLHVRVDPAYRDRHCAASSTPDIRIYMEEAGQDLISLNHPSISAMIAEVVRQACA
jgi:hypothetical protein